MRSWKEKEKKRLGSEDLDNRSWLSRIPSSFDGNLPQRHWNQWWGESAELEEDWRDSGEMQ